MGATTADVIAFRELADEVVLLDVKEGFAEGKALDIYQTTSLLGVKTRITGTTKANTGKVNIAYVELPSLGKCQQSQVYNKIDQAMQLTGLDPATKGTKHTDMGEGYGAYRDYKSDKTLELALLCDYNGANYKLQLRVLPDYR